MNLLTSVVILVQKWLRKQVQGKGYFWMGLTDKGEENVWRWLDGTQPAFTYAFKHHCYMLFLSPTNKHQQHHFIRPLLACSMWKPGQPDNWGHGHDISGEDCAGLVHEALWNDFFCQDLIFYICEKEQEQCE